MFIMYEGWDAEKEKENRSTLVEKQCWQGWKTDVLQREKGSLYQQEI